MMERIPATGVLAAVNRPPASGSMPPQQCLTHPPESDRTRCILVVEDEVLVRMNVAGYLRERGYHVIEAKTADEAVLVLGTQTKIDMVFSDIVMPGSMDGFALSRWLHRVQPQIKILLTSAIVRPAEIAGQLSLDETALLPKPYEPNELLRRIERLMERS
jgi:CheY-like chemotaxis protein